MAFPKWKFLMLTSMTGRFQRSISTPRKYLVSKDYFNCFSCHVQGGKTPEGPKEGWAPDLAMARQRLNPNWIIKWLKDPQKVQPGTKMPSFYPGGPDDILGGKEDLQIRRCAIIWSHLVETGAPAPAAAAVEVKPSRRIGE